MPIFTHATVGVNNLEKSRGFYDGVLGALGLKRLFDIDDRSGYGAQAPEFMIIRPINGQPAACGNGQTLGFAAANRAAVDAFHKEALARGGKDEGAPGLRPMVPNMYAAYIRDLDGNKLTAISFTPE